ncbi:MAG: hypothetical protein AB7S74_03670 [Hyphomicrobium sp.]
MKKIGLVATLGALMLAVAGTASVALEEQKGPAAPAGAEAGAAVRDAAPPAKTEGTEIRIPGLGKLGTLPKMDFGLELLYGATETGPATQEPSKLDDSLPDDLTIRGSVKHRF